MRVMTTIIVSVMALNAAAQQPQRFNVIVQRKSAAVADVETIQHQTTPAADTASDLKVLREGVIKSDGKPRLKDKEYYLCFYSASWCTFCHAFEQSPEYGKIKAAYGITTVDFESCPREWKVNISRLPTLQLRRISDRKLIKQWIGAVTLQQIDDARHSHPKQAIPVEAGVTQAELIRIHDRLHNQASGLNATWTWSGDLRTHLRTVHGVAL